MTTNYFGDYTGRVKGTGRTEVITPKVHLMSVTNNPVGTLFSLWHASRHNEYIDPADAQFIYENWDSITISKINSDPYFKSEVDRILEENIPSYICSCYPEHAGESGTDICNVIRQIAKMNLVANVPSAESVTFNFAIDDATVALREQMVRSKLASYWTQTSRTASLTSMDVNMSRHIEMYGGEKAVDIYEETVETIREAYRKLGALGVPVEEIRLAPESRVHRVMWMIDARALLPILSKRASWIAQATLWSPIIAQVSRIVREVDPMFSEFLGKCDGVTIANGRVTFYKYDNEVEDRYFGRDPQPCDPLWLAYKGITMPEHTNLEFYDAMKDLYIDLWSDDILEILGWDRKDRSKLGKYDRPALYWDDHNPRMIDGLKRVYEI